MINNSNNFAETFSSGLIKTGELAGLCLIWLGLQTMVILAEVVSEKSTD